MQRPGVLRRLRDRNGWTAVRRSVVQEENGQMDPQGLLGHGEELVVFSELSVNSWNGFKYG